MRELIAGIKIFNCQPEIISEKLRISLSSGTQLAAEIAPANCNYCQGAYVPKEPWREPTETELDLLCTKELPSPHLGVGIMRLPQSILDLFTAAGITKAIDKQEVLQLAATEKGEQALAATREFFQPFCGERETPIINGIGGALPNLLTSTVDKKRNCANGLHTDNWDRIPVQNKHLATNRICLNLGLEDRFFLFINLPEIVLLELIGKSSPENLAQPWSRDWGEEFMRMYPEYPVVRVRIAPGEAYIGPTENMIHDGSTWGKKYLDVKAMMRGHYAIKELPNYDDPISCYNWGKKLQQKGDFLEAIEFYQRAILLKPNYYDAYFPLRYTPLGKNNKVNENLINFYYQILTQIPDSHLIYAHLGMALTRQGKISEAINCFQKSAYYKNRENHPNLAQLSTDNIPNKEPDFIVIGSPRCGTTSLYKYITSHPEIFVSAEKEVNFFNDNFALGISWYLSHFLPNYPDMSIVTGEASPNYFSDSKSAARLASFYPNIKLILILRNPIERAFSHYQMSVRRGTERRSFMEAIESEWQILNAASPADLIAGNFPEKINYIWKSLYFYHWQKWLQYFKKEQFLIVSTKDLQSDPVAVLQQVFNFLGVREYQQLSYQQYNQGFYDVMDSTTYNKLNDYFQSHNENLFNDLGYQLY